MGHMDLDTREWADGVLTDAARQVRWGGVFIYRSRDMDIVRCIVFGWYSSCN